jgi:hypothetical protein
MEIEYKQPKLKDSLYGEMLWEDDFEEQYWFARIKNNEVGEHEVLVYADSPTDFMFVRLTHSTYRKILENLAKIKHQSSLYLLKNEKDLPFEKNRHKEFVVKKIESGLQLFCIKIYQDLSSEVIFDSEMFDETDEFIFTALEPNGEFAESSIDTF